MSSSRQPGQTWVSTIHVGGLWPRDAPVQGILSVSAKPELWELIDFKGPIVTVGRTGLIQVLDDPALARHQCLIAREGKRVELFHDARAENPTTVNGVFVTSEGTCLQPGYLIRAGNTKLLAVGPWSPENPLPISAADRHEFIELAVAWHGSLSAAARALDMDRTTLRRHLRATPTGRALLEARGNLGPEIKRLRSIPEPIDDGRAVPETVDDSPWNDLT